MYTITNVYTNNHEQQIVEQAWQECPKKGHLLILLCDKEKSSFHLKAVYIMSFKIVIKVPGF